MSNHSPAVSASETPDAGLVEGAKRVAAMSAGAVVLIVGVLIALAVVMSPPDAQDARLSADAIAKRIARVGAVEVRDASAPATHTGEQVFAGQCSGCHASGALGAPKFGDKAAWSARIAKGFAALWESALHGKNAMPAQSGGQFTDLEVARGVVYMANAGGAKFPEPTESAKPAK